MDDEYRIPPDAALPQSTAIALELLDSILSNAVGVHILPATAETRARAESRVLRGGEGSPARRTVMPETYMNLDKRRKLELEEKKRAQEEGRKRQAIEARRLLKAKQEQLVYRKQRRPHSARRKRQSM